MTGKKQVTKIEEKRGQVMGMVRMSKNNGKKSVWMIEWQVESAKTMPDWFRWKMSRPDTRLCRSPPKT